MLASAGFLLFFIFSLFFLYARTRRRVIKLQPSELLMGFGFKVLMGCVYGFIFYKYYGGDDTWVLHHGSIDEYQKLMRRPGQFFADFDLTASFRRNDGFAAGWYFLLSDLEYWIITKPLAIFNMYSRGNYYINIIFFNLLTFGGQYLVYKLFAARFAAHRRLIFFLAFLFPSAAFWLSGIRPDGWIMLAMGVALYYFHAWLLSKRIKHLLLSIAGLTGLIIFRSPVLLILLPGLLAWFIAEKTRLQAWKIFLPVYAVCVLLFFASAYISADANMLTFVVHRQQEFFQLKGNTIFKLNALEPTAASFLQTLPQALMNTFVRPFVWEAKGALQWLSAFETLFTWMVLAAAIIKSGKTNALIWLCLCFGICLYIFIGYTVPFPGAIARYKVIPELLMIIACFMIIKSDKEKI